MNAPTLSKFTCTECNEDFYLELVGKSAADAAIILMNLDCPRCHSHTQITIHGVLYVALNKQEWRRPPERELIYMDVDKEREHQDTKHPVFPISDYERSNILGEEVGELCQVINHLKELGLSPEEYRQRIISELNDVIAVGVRWREHL